MWLAFSLQFNGHTDLKQTGRRQHEVTTVEELSTADGASTRALPIDHVERGIPPRRSFREDSAHDEDLRAILPTLQASRVRPEDHVANEGQTHSLPTGQAEEVNYSDV